MRIAVALAVALGAAIGRAPAQVDAALAEVIQTTKAIDNHAHPLRYVAEGQKPDDEFDALPCPASEPAGALRSRPDNPEWIGAWRALYGYKYNDAAPEHVKELMAAKQRAINEHGKAYPAWVLDKIGIETMFANRVAPGAGLEAPRFRWVPFADALIVPLNNERTKRLNPDFDWLYTHEEALLKRYLADLEKDAPLRSLREYLSKVVTATLERQKQAGAVAVKFEAAYLRPLNFGRISEEAADLVYARYVRGGEAPGAEYRRLQDFLFHYIAEEAGRLGLAIHIHTGPGCGDYFVQRGANAALLETTFNDPSLRKTNFVIVHGSWPETKQVAVLVEKPNVYADFSNADAVLYPQALAGMLRNWLEFEPEKILFGTDAYAGSGEIGWEETGWLAATSARQALGVALTGMVKDGEISLERAKQMARMVLRENAVKLYGLK